MFSLTGYRREVFLARMHAAQAFRLRGALFESMMALEQARKARTGAKEYEPSFPNRDRAETLFSTFWTRGADRAA